jgi:hypothetical protein
MSCDRCGQLLEYNDLPREPDATVPKLARRVFVLAERRQDEGCRNLVAYL